MDDDVRDVYYLQISFQTIINCADSRHTYSDKQLPTSKNTILFYLLYFCSRRAFKFKHFRVIDVNEFVINLR